VSRWPYQLGASSVEAARAAIIAARFDPWMSASACNWTALAGGSRTLRRYAPCACCSLTQRAALRARLALLLGVWLLGITATARDLRRTWKSLCGECGVSKELRDRIQNHAQSDVSAKHYDKYSYLPEKKAALEQWERYLRMKLAGDNIVPLKRQA